MIRPRSLLGLSLLTLAVGAPEQPPDYEVIRRRRLAKICTDFIAEGLSREETADEVERLDREAIEIAGSEGADWSWGMDQALRYRRTQLLLARGREVIADGRAAVEASREAREKARTIAPGDVVTGPMVCVATWASPAAAETKPVATINMAEVNRRRREAGELGTKRQRKDKKRKSRGVEVDP